MSMPVSLACSWLRWGNLRAGVARYACALLGFTVLVCHVAGAAELAASVTSPDRSLAEAWRASALPWPAASRGNAPGLPVTAEFVLPPEQIPELSPAASRVRLIAGRNGDREFLMVDKVHGRIMLFADGRPIFSRPALTGESMADRILPDAWTTPWARQGDLRYKVTPAGRFTITRDHDNALGDVFDINELKGRDWTIAIHRVWLGKQSERRDARLRSTADQDKHITAGCVDVDPGTIVQLWRLLPRNGVPLYILPIDDGLIAELFQSTVRRAGFSG